MTNNKKKGSLRKGVIGVLVALAVLTCGGLTANAATDGAVSRAIEEGISHFKITVNGEQQDLSSDSVDCETYVDENGEKVNKYTVTSPDGGYSITIVDDAEGTECLSNVDGAIGIEINDYSYTEPTTALAE